MATVQESQKLLEDYNKGNNEALKKDIQESFKDELVSFKEEIKELVSDSLKEANELKC